MDDIPYIQTTHPNGHTIRTNYFINFEDYKTNKQSSLLSYTFALNNTPQMKPR